MEFLYTCDHTPKVTGISNQLQSCFPHSCPYASCASKLCNHHTCGINCAGTCRRYVCGDCRISKPHQFATLASGTPSQLRLHSQMYTIADKYIIAGLGDLAKMKFEAASVMFYDTADFGKAAEHTFTTTPNTRTWAFDRSSRTRTSVASKWLRPF